VNMTIVIGTVADVHAIGMTAAQIVPLMLAAAALRRAGRHTGGLHLGGNLWRPPARRRGCALARLSALQEVAMIDVLCVDKTGTLTTNSLGVGRVVALAEGLSAAVLLSRSAAG